MPMLIQIKGNTFGGGIQSGRRRSLWASFSSATSGRRAFNTENVLRVGQRRRRKIERAFKPLALLDYLSLHQLTHNEDRCGVSFSSFPVDVLLPLLKAVGQAKS